MTEIAGSDDPNFEGADAQISYDPTEDTTIAAAQKFDVVMTNLLTEESLLVPEGSIGVVQGSTIQTIDMMIFFPEGDDSLMDIIRTQGDGENTVKAQLDRVALVLTQLQLQHITIEGYTDNVGEESANKQLAQRRADNVKEYFVTYYNLAPDLFQTISYGEEKPIDTNETEAGHARNRRVEIHY
jgi:outer membrane protein OmpA-like peptidoglycan-associated protein